MQSRFCNSIACTTGLMLSLLAPAAWGDGQEQAIRLSQPDEVFVESWSSPVDAGGVAAPQEDPNFTPAGYSLAAHSGDSELSYIARARGGAGYLQDDFASQFGGSYGIDLAIPLAEQFGAFGGATYSHYDDGTQFFSSVGVYRQGLDCGGAMERISGGVLFDQLVDTRFDDLHVSQIRCFLGAALTDNFAAGVTYSDSTNNDTAFFAAPRGPTAYAFQPAETIEAYASCWVGPNLITATVGHRDDTSDVTAGCLLRRYLTRTAVGYFSFNSAGSDLWAGTLGLEWHFGNGMCRGPRRHASGGLLASAAAPGGAIVRGQSGSVLGNPFADASLGHNLSYGPEVFASRLSTSRIGGGGLGVTTTGGVDDPIDDPPVVDPSGEEGPLDPRLWGLF